MASGLAFVAQKNDFGYIDVTKFAPSFFPGGDAQAIPSTDFNNNYYRLAVTPTLGNWAIVAGIGGMNGSSWAATAGVPVEMETRKTFADFQAQGEVGGKELGVYIQYAKAPAAAFGKDQTLVEFVSIPDLYKTHQIIAQAHVDIQGMAQEAGADYSVIPHKLSIGAAYRDADTGAAANVNGADAWTLTGIYDLYQNVALHVNYSKYSGSSITDVGGNATAKHLVTFMLEGAW